MASSQSIESLANVVARSKLDREDLAAVYQLVRSQRISFPQAMEILSQADADRSPSSPAPVHPTIAQLLAAWGAPPTEVIEDWVEQLRGHLACCTPLADRGPGFAAALDNALQLDTITVDAENRLEAPRLLTLRHESYPPHQRAGDKRSKHRSEPAPKDPHVRKVLDAFAARVNSALDGDLPAALPERGSGSRAKTFSALQLDRHTRTGPSTEERQSRNHSGSRATAHRGKKGFRPFPARGIGLALTVGLVVGITCLMVPRIRRPAVEGVPGPPAAGSPPAPVDSAVGQEAELASPPLESFQGFSDEILPEPTEQASADLLDQFATLDASLTVPSATPPAAASSLPHPTAVEGIEGNEAASPRTLAEGLDAFSSGGVFPLDDAAAPSDASDAADFIEAKTEYEADVELDSSIETKWERPTQVVQDAELKAVALPPRESEVGSVLLHPQPAVAASLEFLGVALEGRPSLASDASVSLKARSLPGATEKHSAVWSIVEQVKSQPSRQIAEVFCDASGTHFRWRDEGGQRSTDQLRNARLRLRFADDSLVALFLRPVVKVEPVAFDFSQRQQEVAWRLPAPPHPVASRLQIRFQLPEAAEQSWIEPPPDRSPRRLVAIAEFTLKQSEWVGLRIRFDVQTGARLACRMRYAARLDPTLPWQWITRPELIALTDRLAVQRESILLALGEAEQLSRRAGGGEEDVLRVRQECLRQRSELTATVAERLEQLLQLTTILQHEGRIVWPLNQSWPDGSQAILVSRLEDSAEGSSASTGKLEQPIDQETRNAAGADGESPRPSPAADVRRTSRHRPVRRATALLGQRFAEEPS